jgi:predicted glycosyltransferase
MHSEARTPLFDLVLGACDSLDIGDKRLVWVAGEPDYPFLVEKSGSRQHLMILKPHYDFTPTIIAADLVITKGNRLLLFECEALGIPSISISFAERFVDDSRLSRIQTNIALRARGLDELALRDYIIQALARASEIPEKSRCNMECHRLAVAKALRSHL